jgi:hypothetical protein
VTVLKEIYVHLKALTKIGSTCQKYDRCLREERSL